MGPPRLRPRGDALAFGSGRDDFRADVVRALIDAYVRRCAQPTREDAERAAFGAELRFVACRFAVTRITDVHLKRDAGDAARKELPAVPASPGQVKPHLARATALLDF